MIISDRNGGNGKVSAVAGLVGRWCGVTPDRDGEIWASHFLNRKVVELEAGARVGFRFKNGDVHSRSAASLRGPVADKMFRWHKSDTWQGGKRLWSPCPPDMGAIRFVLLVEGETSAIAAAFALAFHYGWWVVATTGAGMFPEPVSESGATLRRIMRSAGAVAVAWPDDDTAGGRWLVGAAGTLEGFPLGQVTGAEGDPRSVWRRMVAAEGLDAATGRFAGMCAAAAAGAEPLAVKLPETEEETERAPYRPVLPPADWKPAANGKREPQPRGAIRRWLARKHPTQDSLMRAGAQPRGRGKMSCWNKEAHRAGDRNPSLSVTGQGEEEHFRCFGCGERGDIFVAYALGYHSGDGKAAARHIYEQIRRESGG